MEVRGHKVLKRKQDIIHNKPYQAELTFWQILAYGCVRVPLAIGFATLIMFIPTYYGIDLKLGLGLVGVLLAAGRVFDFITDPLIGFLSDKINSRFGVRKPLVCLGLSLFCLATFLLFLPPQNVSPIYFFISACLYFLSFTLCDIPVSAIGLEVSVHTDERTRLALSRALFFILGGMIGASIPLIWKQNLETSFSIAVLTIFITAIITGIIFLCFSPTSARQNNDISHKSILKTFPNLLANIHIRRILILFFLLMLASSLASSLSLLYVSFILKAPKALGLFWLASGVGILCGLPLWYFVSLKIGKIECWRRAILLTVLFGLPLIILGEGDNYFMIGISFALGVCGACDLLIPVSMLADHVGENDSREAGSITALKNSVSKLSIIGPMLMAFPLLGYIGISRETAKIAQVSADLTQFQSIILIGLYAGLPLTLRLTAFFAVPKLWPNRYKP